MKLLIGFWGLLLAACIVWYSTITIYIAIRGAADIRKMLASLNARNESERAEASGETDPRPLDHTAV